jgi:hypothetical protein
MSEFAGAIPVAGEHAAHRGVVAAADGEFDAAENERRARRAKLLCGVSLAWDDGRAQ